jgi:hypothetical protein
MCAELCVIAVPFAIVVVLLALILCDEVLEEADIACLVVSGGVNDLGIDNRG